MTHKGRSIKKPTEFAKILSKRPGYHFVMPLKANAFSIKDMTEQEKDAHFITELLLQYLNDGEYQKFCEEREELIYTWEVQRIVKPAAHSIGIINIDY